MKTSKEFKNMGRKSAYLQAIRDANMALAIALERQKTYPRKSAFWDLTEGEIRATEEILQLLKNSLERNSPYNV